MPLEKAAVSLPDQDLAQAWATLPLPGEHSVGVRHFHATDLTREDPTTATRQFMASAWYPALPDSQALPARLTDILYPHPEDALRAMANRGGLEPGALAPIQHKLTTLTLRAKRQPHPITEGKFPVLIYYPGGMGHRFTNAGLCEALASLGYVVFSLDAPRDAPIVVFPDGQIVLQGMPDDEDYIWPRIADVKFLLDSLPELNATLFQGSLELAHIGMFGASRGGYLSNITAVEDTRIKAAINMDGFLWGLWTEGTGLQKYPPEWQSRARALQTPILRLQGDQGGTDKAKAKFEQESQDFGGPFIYAALHGWKHADFGHLPWLSGDLKNFGTNAERVAAPEDRQKRLLGIVADFFDTYLRSKTGGLELIEKPAQDGDVFYRL